MYPKEALVFEIVKSEQEPCFYGDSPPWGNGITVEAMGVVDACGCEEREHVNVFGVFGVLPRNVENGVEAVGGISLGWLKPLTPAARELAREIKALNKKWGL